MSKTPTLLEHFRSFCFQNNISDFEQAVEYFAVFGGMGWRVDTSISIDELIEQKILANYRYIHADITLITKSNPIYHSLLSAVALGDRREYSAFKRTRMGREKGEEGMDFLIDKGFLRVETSVEKPINGEDDNSDKLMFVEPFMRFWFAVISPYFKGIRDGDYSEMRKKWAQMKHEFSDLIYTHLLMELLSQNLEDEGVMRCGAYWDKNVEIDILIKTKAGEMIAGSCRYSKTKAGKSDLNRLKELCDRAELGVSKFVIFSKHKFTSELKKQKGENLMLLSSRHMTNLISELSQDDLLHYTHKLY